MVLYFPHSQNPSGGLYVVARTASDTAAISTALVREIHAVDAGSHTADLTFNTAVDTRVPGALTSPSAGATR